MRPPGVTSDDAREAGPLPSAIAGRVADGAPPGEEDGAAGRVAGLALDPEKSREGCDAGEKSETEEDASHVDGAHDARTRVVRRVARRR